MTNRTAMAAAVALLATGATIGAVAPAAAECRANTSASSGVRASEAGATERACAQARSKWADVVRRRYGARFTLWSAARTRLQALRVEGSLVRCYVQAIPCTPPVRAPRR